MKKTFETVEAYIDDLPDDRKDSFLLLRETILQNIPNGFQETISYEMVGYVVPHTLYPAGYHCSPELPLPFISLGNQKNFIGLYHMGLYADEKMYAWFTEMYGEHCKYKLDMGKSCVRFKRMDDIPYTLIAELVKKVTVDDWIEQYEQSIKKK